MGKTNKSDNYNAVLLEDINSKFDFIVEVVADIKQKTDRIPYIELRLDNLETDMKVVKAAAIKTNLNVAGHAAQLRELKAKPA